MQCSMTGCKFQFGLSLWFVSSGHHISMDNSVSDVCPNCYSTSANIPLTHTFLIITSFILIIDPEDTV